MLCGSLDGTGVWGRMNTYVYGWIPSLFTWNYHNIVNRLNPNIKFLKKVKRLALQVLTGPNVSPCGQGVACPAPPQETMGNKSPFQRHSLPDPHYTWTIIKAALWNSAHGRWLGVMKGAVLFRWCGKASLKKPQKVSFEQKPEGREEECLEKGKHSTSWRDNLLISELPLLSLMIFPTPFAFVFLWLLWPCCPRSRCQSCFRHWFLSPGSSKHVPAFLQTTTWTLHVYPYV